jgi:hypothetical protein
MSGAREDHDPSVRFADTSLIRRGEEEGVMLLASLK